MLEIEGQRSLVKETVMQGAQDGSSGDRARSTSRMPANVCSVETDHAVSQTEAQTTKRASLWIGAED